MDQYLHDVKSYMKATKMKMNLNMMETWSIGGLAHNRKKGSPRAIAHL